MLRTAANPVIDASLQPDGTHGDYTDRPSGIPTVHQIKHSLQAT
jgi:hypothetical protein